MSAPSISVGWGPREPPLGIAAVAAWGDRATELASRAVARQFRDGALAVVASDAVLVLIGSGEDLPWADGAVYLGRDPAAAGMLLPTILSPSVPVDVLERAVRKRFAATGPIAVIPRGSTVEVLPLGDACGVSVSDLSRWVAKRQAAP
ncbi:MAG: hypothetical protein JWM53_353 [bacterium]|nr:hypothetical protein [bacterium]